MTLEQAFNNLVLVARKFTGTADEHEALQQSLKMVKEAIKEEEAKAAPVLVEKEN